MSILTSTTVTRLSAASDEVRRCGITPLGDEQFETAVRIAAAHACGKEFSRDPMAVAPHLMEPNEMPGWWLFGNKPYIGSSRNWCDLIQLVSPAPLQSVPHLIVHVEVSIPDGAILSVTERIGHEYGHGLCAYCGEPAGVHSACARCGAV